MAATIRKRGKNYIVTIHHQGKRQSESFTVKREAEAAVKKYNKMLKSGEFDIKPGYVDNTETLNHYIDLWYNHSVLADGDEDEQLAKGTQERYLAIWKNKIRRDIGKKAVADLKAHDLFNYAEDLKTKGHTRSDISLRFCVLSGGFERARLKGKIDSNPSKEILKHLYSKRKPKEKGKIVPFTQTETDLILAKARTQDYCLLLLLFHTGCRLGEALGLNWDSINFNKNPYVVIQRSFRSGHLSDQTKTGNDRIVPIGKELVSEFEKLKMKHRKDKLKGSDCEAVFVSKGKRLSQNSFRNAWKRVLDKSGIEYRKTHIIRHTVATRLLNGGNPVKLVAEILGHTVQTLLSTYSHEMESSEDRKRDMMKSLQNADKRGQEKRPENDQSFPGLTKLVPKRRNESSG